MPLTENQPTRQRPTSVAAAGKENSPPSGTDPAPSAAPPAASITTPARVFRRSRSQRRGRGHTQRRGRGRGHTQRRGRGRN